VVFVKRFNACLLAVLLSRVLPLGANSAEIPVVSKTVTVNKRWLNIPVMMFTNVDQNVRSSSQPLELVDRHGSLIRSATYRFPEPGRADWIYSMDVSSYEGMQLTLKTRSVNSNVLDGIALSDESGQKPGPNLYREKFRPQFHYSVRRGWMNDPNGLHYANGTYHLFYQYNPFALDHSAGFNMHWGYATSTDLFHWVEQEPVLYPGPWGQCYSGSGFLDENNALGLNSGGEKAQVLCFTATRNVSQNIVWSTDSGATWNMWTNNPALSRQRGFSRDPKVFYYSPGSHWVMVLHLGGRREESAFGIFVSSDLKNWKQTDEISGFYECPDLFELPLDGNPRERKWVLHGGAAETPAGRFSAWRSSYYVGTFDGKKFTPETERITGHKGPNFYAAQSFNNLPEDRVILLGWAGYHLPDMPFGSCMTVPLEATLRKTPEGTRLFLYPVREIESLRLDTKTEENLTLTKANVSLADLDAELLDIQMEIRPASETVGLNVRGVSLVYDSIKQTVRLSGDRFEHPAPLKEGVFSVRVLVDRGFLELFVNGGVQAFAMPAEYRGSEIMLTGDAGIERLVVCSLCSAWEPH
jgi:sucrose-6-phosphate hydrolase SacC (GH32 family)